jgi:signal peptidase II
MNLTVNPSELTLKNYNLENLLKKFFKQYWILITVVAAVITLDQITKWLIRTYISFGSVWMPWEWLRPFLKIVYWHNTGAAFGLFQNGALIFGIMAVVVSAFIIIYYPRIPQDEKLMRVALSMQMGGALGNLIDRLFHEGHVTDWISVGDFPVFNVADSSITVGVALLILALWLSERKERQKEAQSEQVPPEEVGPVDKQV